MGWAPSGAMKFLGPRRELKEYALHESSTFLNMQLAACLTFLPIDRL